jgi:hypothetical protein
VPTQPSLYDAAGTRSILDRLISDSQLYRQSKDYFELLDFIARLPHIAPFNAMILQIQKPGLKFAMTKKDWWERFGRYPVEGARPLIIMWPFGPVGFVYDQIDTEGDELPQDVSSFVARGNVGTNDLNRFKEILERKEIFWYEIDVGDAHAGLVRVLKHSDDPEIRNKYRININKNHGTATQFATLIHELGHIFLGHLGLDTKRKIKDRQDRSDVQMELEAESVSHIICSRTGIESRSEPYLERFVRREDALDDIDIYAVLTAAGAIESMLELNPRAFKSPQI